MNQPVDWRTWQLRLSQSEETRDWLMARLRYHGGNLLHCAAEVGMDRSNLRKMARWLVMAPVAHWRVKRHDLTAWLEEVRR